MPILGTIASSTRQGQATDLGAMFPLQVITVGADASSITFTNIPSTYTHLQIRGWGYNGSGSDRALGVVLNADQSASYSAHYLLGTGASVFSGGLANRGQVWLYEYNSAQAGFNGDVTKASAFVIDILDYANTNKNKTVKALGGWEGNGSGIIGVGSGAYYKTNAITTVTLILAYSTNFKLGTTFALYGVKSA